MKKIIVILCSIAAIISLSCKKSDTNNYSGEKGSLTWYSFNEGMEKAQAENKNVFIDFYAGWCHWCIVMEQESFTRKDVVDKLNKNFVCVRIYTDRPDNEIIQFKGRQLSTDQFTMVLGVMGLPTLIFLDPEENVIMKVPGYAKKDVFISVLDYIEQKCYTMNVDFEDFATSKKTCMAKK